MSSISMRQKNITTIHTGSADGKVLKIAVTSDTHGLVRITRFVTSCDLSRATNLFCLYTFSLRSLILGY